MPAHLRKFVTQLGEAFAAGQMGPFLLGNFTRDRGVGVSLGACLGMFCYALMALRSVCTPEERPFTPHLSVTVDILLTFVCVATLVHFVGHMAGRVSVDTVVEPVRDDVRRAIGRLTVDAAAKVLGATRVSSTDPELAVRQLVEVAVRALSPGIDEIRHLPAPA